MCLYTLEEHNCYILTSLHVQKMRYSAHARKYKPLLYCTDLFKRNKLKYFVNRWQMNITAEFKLPSIIPRYKLHFIHIETILTVYKLQL